MALISGVLEKNRKMENEIEVVILPSIYVRSENDGNIIKSILPTGEILEGKFSLSLLNGIENPKYLFVGVITGVNKLHISICDGNEYEEMFNEHWKELLK